MVKNVWLLFLTFAFGCSTSNDHPLIGSWKECHKWNGEYIEHRYFDDYVFYATEGYWYPTTFPFEIQNDTFMIESLGRLLKFKIDPITRDSLMLRSDQDTIFLIRLEEEIPVVDSLHLEEWLTTYEADFRRRSEQWTACVRLPEPELLDLGEVDDDFDDIIDLPDTLEMDSTYVQ